MAAVAPLAAATPAPAPPGEGDEQAKDGSPDAARQGSRPRHSKLSVMKERRKSRRVSALNIRRSSRLGVSDGRTALEEEEEIHCAQQAVIAGVLLDYVERPIRVRRMKPQFSKVGCPHAVNSLMALCKENVMNYAYAEALCCREHLLSALLELVMGFQKGLGPKRGGWPRTDAGTLKACATNIVAYKRMVCCLRVEVDNWLMRYKLLHSRAHHQSETAREKHSRLEEFWTQYHTHFRRNDLPAQSSLGDAGRERDHGGGACRGAAGRASGGGQCNKTSDLAEEQWSLVARVEAQDRDGSHSGGETAGGRRHGMRWCAGEPGAPGQLKYEPRHGGGGERRGMPKATSLPILPRTRTPVTAAAAAAAAAGAAGGGRKASETPTGATGGGGGACKLPELENTRRWRCGDRDDERGGDASSPTQRYLQVCRGCLIVPTPIPFVTGHSLRLNAAGRDLIDAELRAVAVMLRDVDSIEEVDLSGNLMLTDKALVPFMRRLHGEPARSTMTKLSLKDCANVGRRTQEAVIRLLMAEDGLAHLRLLDLSHVPIAVRCHLALAKAIRAHRSLNNVNLADTGLGSSIMAKETLGEVLSSTTIQTLDLGWNCLTKEVFAHIGQQLVEMETLRSLSLSNTSSAEGAETPIAFFLEYLAQDSTLTKLDLSLNRVDFRTAFVIEDALENHSKLTHLNLSDNPLGVHGIRSAIRLLAHHRSGLRHFDCESCYKGQAGADPGSSSHEHAFNVMNPGGRYRLDLSRPYHRTLLRRLYKMCDHWGMSPVDGFKDITFSKPPYVHPSKDSDGVYRVPYAGTLAVSFVIEGGVERAITGISDTDFGGFLSKHYQTMKRQPGFREVVPLLACWNQLNGRSIEQTVFIEALAKDFMLTPAQLAHICESSPHFTCEAIARLLHCTMGGSMRWEANRSLCMLLFPTLGELSRTHEKMRALLDFNIENPTGHYKLNLSNCCDHAVAEQLLLLDRWETVIDRRLNRADTSQRGNRSHCRNEHFQGRPMHLAYMSIADWCMPEYDVFEFDYISNKRASADAAVWSDEPFEDFLRCLYESSCSPGDNILVLRMIAHYVSITSLQLRAILGTFKEEAQRVEVFVTFFLRVVDMWNAKVFRVRFSSQKEKKHLQDRLGYVTSFPFIQPENAFFSLNMAFYDQRLCANILLHLSAKEKPHNIHDPVFHNADGDVDPLPLGVPRSWERFELMPTAGVFKATYMCAPEFRKFSVRKELCARYGLFSVDVCEQDVMWWTGLTETPEDVLELLEFFTGRFTDLMEAFIQIDGVDGNGVITLQELNDGLKEMGCHKFKGKDGPQRINAIFRYLDPGGEGSVSKEEWMVLDQLWKEYKLSVTEFVDFLQLTFGEDLSTAWSFIDSDGSGELSMDEWCGAITQIGYFGPAKVVFGLLDRSDDGAISLEEFSELEAYKRVPGQTSASIAHILTPTTNPANVGRNV